MSAPSLFRHVFTTSRLAVFCSEKELINQTGHDSDEWPLVVLKELIDNALDACFATPSSAHRRQRKDPRECAGLIATKKSSSPRGQHGEDTNGS